MNLLHSIGAVIGSVFLAIGSFFAPVQAPVLTGVQDIAGFTYTLSGAGISSSATSIILSSFTVKQTGQPIQDSDMSDTFYLTIEPGNTSRQEIVSCTTVGSNTGSSVTLSGCVRGLSPLTPYTASSTLQFAHSGGAQVIFSNPPQQQRQYPAKANTEYITGAWGFQGSVPTSTNCTSANELCNYTVVSAMANQGAATSTFANGGIVELAKHSEAAAGTASSSPTGPLVLLSLYSNATPFNCDTIACIPVAVNKLISAQFISTSSVYRWTGNHTFTAATSTEFGITSGFDWGGVRYTLNSAVNQATGTVLTQDGTGGLSFATTSVFAPVVSSVTGLSTTNTSTTSLLTYKIAPNTLKTTTRLKVTAEWSYKGGVCQGGITFGSGAASTTVGYTLSGTFVGALELNIVATSTGTGYAYSMGQQYLTTNQPGTLAYTNFIGVPIVYDFTGVTYLSFDGAIQGGASGTCTLAGKNITLYTQ